MTQWCPRLVTVAIPVRNGAATIAEQLEALEAQAYPHDWEVLVVDNGSTDNTAEIVRAWGLRLRSLRVISEPRPGIGPARNRALKEARGDAMAICDADDIVQPGWLAGLVEGLREHELVGGHADMSLSNPPKVVKMRGALPTDRLPEGIGAWPFAPGGNMAVRVDVARELHGWDEMYVAGSDDIDFSWRMSRAGYSLGFAPTAVIDYRLRPGLRMLMRQFYSYGKSESLLYRQHREFGLPNYTARDFAKLWRVLGPALVRESISHNEFTRGAALRELAYRSGRIAGSAKHRVMFP